MCDPPYCAAVGFGDITSQNVVGYQNKELKGNAAYNLSVATFKAVDKDSDKMVLGDIAANGAVDKAYSYVGATDAAEWGCPAGWYLTADLNDDSIEDLTPLCKNAIPVKAGEAFIVLVGTATTTITIPSAL